MSDITLKSFPRRDTKRRGRGPGSGQGKTSGRGNKGQKARAGGGVRPGFEGGQMPLYRRLPKRGFTNIFRKDVQTVSLSVLAKAFKSGEEVTTEALAKKRLITPRKNTSVKILRDVDKFDVKLSIKLHGISAKARELVEKAGGSFVSTSPPRPVYVPPVKPVSQAKPEAPEKAEKSEKPTKAEKAAKAEKPVKNEKKEKPGAGS